MPPSTTSAEHRRRPLRAWSRAVLATALATVSLLAHARAGTGAPRPQTVLRGIVTWVTDGDTVWVRPDAGGEPRKVRLLGIDAPEICQAYGAAARDALARLLHGQAVLLRGGRRDDYDRLLARIATRSLPDVGGWMVVQGHAWSYRHGRGGGPYAREEAQARAAARGLWSQPAMEPRAFRRSHGSCHTAG